MKRTFLSALFGLSLALPLAPVQAADEGVALFAGGCFWCVESDFDKIKGVTSTVSGYIGTSIDNPTYENYVAAGGREVVEIRFDPSVVSYDALLKVFFRTVDPTDAGGQFCDRGHAYSTAVYTFDDGQKKSAEAAVKDAGAALGATIATTIEPATKFWPAEEYHQDYYDKNPVRYKYYRFACGRDAAVKKLWGNQAYTGIGS